jgi:hypothetical protein
VGLDLTKPYFDGPPSYSYSVPCNENDGTVTVSARGATEPYTFFLYDGDDNLITEFTVGVGQTTHTFTGLTPGNYRVDVKGVYACIETTGPFTLPARNPVMITESITNIECFGDNNGSITLDISGGSPPFSFLWSTGNSSQNLLNIGAGSYTVSITDADNCVTEETFVLIQPAQITAAINKTDDPGNDGQGSASVTANGGTPSYTYLWLKTGDPAFVFQPSNTENAVTNLTYGEYTVSVTDANGCSDTFAVFIFEKEICNDGIDNNGNGLTDCDDPACKPAQTSTIITSDENPCVNPGGVPGFAYTYTYSVNPSPDYDSYLWTVPASAVIVSGQETNEITVAWVSLGGGQICVQGKKFDCISQVACINVVVDDVPPKPAGIILTNN